MPVSLPSRQRSTTFCPAAEAGRIATVVTKPLFEFPVQARRPCSGLPLKSESVPSYVPTTRVPPAARMSWKEPPPILISSTPPSKVFSV
jgi:hypothetical protein